MNERRQAFWINSAAAGLVLLFFLQGYLSLQRKAPTFDEVGYYGIGHYLLKRGAFDVPGSGTHPPLSFYLSSLPLLGEALDVDVWRYSEQQRSAHPSDFTLLHDPQRSHRLLQRSQPRDLHLNRGRMVVLGLGFLLGPLIYLWSRRCFGAWGALVSLVLFAFDPNLLAHGRLITPDFTLTTCFFAAAYFAATAALNPSPQLRRSILLWGSTALFAGLALLSKHSALALTPVLGLPYLLDRSHPNPPHRRALVLLAVAAGAGLVLALGYQLAPWHYLESLQRQLAHAGTGHRSYLLGELSEQGWWYYHFVALALKTPLPLVLLLFMAGTRWTRNRPPPRELLALLLPPLALVALFTVVRGPNIGLRYLLPVYPFLIVLAGGAVTMARRSRLAQCAIVCLLGWQIASSLSIYPDYLAYFNESIGGARHGYKYLVDSNLDWGQDLKALKQYMDENAIDKVRLSYFGAAQPEMYDIAYEPLPGYRLGQHAPLPEDWRGTIVVSATNLAGIYLDSDVYARLRGRQPDAVIGYTLFVYHLK